MSFFYSNKRGVAAPDRLVSNFEFALVVYNPRAAAELSGIVKASAH